MWSCEDVICTRTVRDILPGFSPVPPCDLDPARCRSSASSNPVIQAIIRRLQGGEAHSLRSPPRSRTFRLVLGAELGRGTHQPNGNVDCSFKLLRNRVPSPPFAFPSALSLPSSLISVSPEQPQARGFAGLGCSSPASPWSGRLHPSARRAFTSAPLHTPAGRAGRAGSAGSADSRPASGAAPCWGAGSKTVGEATQAVHPWVQA